MSWFSPFWYLFVSSFSNCFLFVHLSFAKHFSISASHSSVFTLSYTANFGGKFTTFLSFASVEHPRSITLRFGANRYRYPPTSLSLSGILLFRPYFSFKWITFFFLFIFKHPITVLRSKFHTLSYSCKMPASVTTAMYFLHSFVLLNRSVSNSWHRLASTSSLFLPKYFSFLKVDRYICIYIYFPHSLFRLLSLLGLVEDQQRVLLGSALWFTSWCVS